MALFAKWVTDNIGSTTQPITSKKANANFMGFYVSNSDATGGTARGMYMRLYLTGTSGQSGEAVRAFTTVNGTGAVGVHGLHASVSLGTSGTITGEASGVRGTMQIANKTVGGTVAGVLGELSADGTSSDATNAAMFRGTLSGDATGAAKLDDDAYFLTIDGAGTTASGNIIQSSVTEANYGYSARCLVNGVVMYLMFATAAG